MISAWIPNAATTPGAKRYKLRSTRAARGTHTTAKSERPVPGDFFCRPVSLQMRIPLLTRSIDTEVLHGTELLGTYRPLVREVVEATAYGAERPGAAINGMVIVNITVAWEKSRSSCMAVTKSSNAAKPVNR